MDSNTLKQIGTGIYAGLDELSFGVLDKIGSYVGGQKFKDWKKERESGKYAKAEKIGDIASILGDIALIPLGGIGVGKIGAKLGLKGVKVGSKALKMAKKADTLGDIAKSFKAGESLLEKVKLANIARKSAIGKGSAILRMGLGGVEGGARAGAESLIRHTMATTDEEKDAIKSNARKGVLIGSGLGVIGGVVAGIQKLKNESGKIDPTQLEATKRELGKSKVARELRESGFSPAYNESLSKRHKMKPEDWKLKDMEAFTETVNDLKKEKGYILDNLQKRKAALSDEYDKLFNGIQNKNYKSNVKAWKESVLSDFRTKRKDPFTKTDDLGAVFSPEIKEYLKSIVDPKEKKKIINVLEKTVESIDVDNPKSILKFQEVIYNNIKQDPKLAGILTKSIEDKLEDMGEAFEEVRKVNTKWRHLKNIEIQLANELKTQTLKDKPMGLATSLISNELIKSVAENWGTGAIIGASTGALSTDKDATLKDKLVKTGIYATAGALGGNLIRKAVNKGYGVVDSAIGETLNSKNALKLISKEKPYNLSQKFLLSGGRKATQNISKNRDIGEVLSTIENQKQKEKQFSSDVENIKNAEIVSRIEQLHALKNNYPDVEIDIPLYENLIKKKVEEKFSAPENIFLALGKKDLAKFNEAKNILLTQKWDSSQNTQFQAFKTLGVSDKEAKAIVKNLAKYGEKYRKNLIIKKLDELGYEKLPPEDYKMMKEWVL